MFKKKATSFEQEVLARIDKIVEAHDKMLAATTALYAFYEKMWGDQQVTVFSHTMPRREAEKCGYMKSALPKAPADRG